MRKYARQGVASSATLQSSSSAPSLTSEMPCAVIWNLASASGMQGESTMRAIRSGPRPLRIETLSSGHSQSQHRSQTRSLAVSAYRVVLA